MLFFFSYLMNKSKRCVSIHRWSNGTSGIVNLSSLFEERWKISFPSIDCSRGNEWKVLRSLIQMEAFLGFFPCEKRYRRLFFGTQPTRFIFILPFFPPSPCSLLLSFLAALPLSASLFYRRAWSTFLCFGRQAEVVVTVCFVESVPEVSRSHDDSAEATVLSTHWLVQAE